MESCEKELRRYKSHRCHLRLQLEEFPAVMVCDLRLDVSGLTVLRYFLEITVSTVAK